MCNLYFHFIHVHKIYNRHYILGHYFSNSCHAVVKIGSVSGHKTPITLVWYVDGPETQNEQFLSSNCVPNFKFPMVNAIVGW